MSTSTRGCSDQLRQSRLAAREDAARRGVSGLLVPFAESVALAAARHDPLLMADQLRRAVEDFLSLECHAHPLLLVLEDFHWGDGATVNCSTRRCAIARSCRDGAGDRAPASTTFRLERAKRKRPVEP
jgi:hypothetical protein